MYGLNGDKKVNTMQTILVVEDEEDILELIEYALSRDGYEIIGALDTSNVVQLLDEEDIDLILMDRNLPGVEGSLFIKDIREQGYSTPVIYISAKDSDMEVLEGFERGGDEYITKPFNLDLLRARVKAMIKRTAKSVDVLKIGDILYRANQKKFFINNEAISLTHLEHDLLLEFMKNQGMLLSRDTLLENVWKDSNNLKPKTVTVAVKRLKEKIDPHGDKGYIQSVRGEGYIFSKEASLC
jgi:DNA-binding response OmpR family regulator